MNPEKIITGIDIGTSKVSVLVCNVKAADDIHILGFGTSILKGVQKGRIKDKSLFTNAIQNALKRAQASSGVTIDRIFINVPNGNNRFTIQTGIVQNESERPSSLKDKELAMKKSISCVKKEGQSVLHLFPLSQRVDGQTMASLTNHKFTNIEVDTGIILCDSVNLDLIIATVKNLGLRVNGIISDYLSLGAVLLPSKQQQEQHLIIDIGAQLTSLMVYKANQLVYANTVQIGSEQITDDLAICLKCSHSEAERIKILHGQLQKYQVELSKDILIQCFDGEKMVKLSLVTSIIESRVNQLYQLVQKYLILAPNYDQIYLAGSGANLKGLRQWMESKFSKPFNTTIESKYKDLNINSNYTIAMGQIIYGYQVGLLNASQSGFKKKLSKLFSK